jgi:uncharacterized Fe-S radical SAM superfamily protein PflX
LIYKKTKEMSIKVLHSENLAETVKTIHEEGHLGIKNMWRRVRLKFDGDRLYEMCKNTVESCDVCQRRARMNFLRTVPGTVVATPKRPFAVVGIDAMGEPPETKEGNKVHLRSSRLDDTVGHSRCDRSVDSRER